MSDAHPLPRDGAEGEKSPAQAQSVRDRTTVAPFLSKIALELFVVFVGVTLAFAVDDFRSRREENDRREAIYRALDHELMQMAETHGPVFQRQMTEQLRAWDVAVARGEQPLPPTFQLPGAQGRRPAFGTRLRPQGALS